MGVTVVKGIAGKAGPNSSSVSTGNGQQPQSPPANVRGVALSQVVQSEAVVTNLKAQRAAVSFERVKDSKEAKQLGDSLAEKIRSQADKDFETHADLDYLSVREHLAR
jgi:hypothetical protein